MLLQGSAGSRATRVFVPRVRLGHPQPVDLPPSCLELTLVSAALGEHPRLRLLRLCYPVLDAKEG